MNYGDRVLASVAACRMRLFINRALHNDPDDTMVGDLRVDTYWNRRARFSRYNPDDATLERWAERTIITPDLSPSWRQRRPGYTEVSVVRVPLCSTGLCLIGEYRTDPTDHEHEPMRGIIVGRTQRQAGRVCPLGWDEGREWATHGSTTVYTVAMTPASDTSPARLFDCPPDALEVLP